MRAIRSSGLTVMTPMWTVAFMLDAHKKSTMSSQYIDFRKSGLSLVTAILAVSGAERWGHGAIGRWQ